MPVLEETLQPQRLFWILHREVPGAGGDPAALGLVLDHLAGCVSAACAKNTAYVREVVRSYAAVWLRAHPGFPVAERFEITDTLYKGKASPVLGDHGVAALCHELVSAPDPRFDAVRMLAYQFVAAAFSRASPRAPEANTVKEDLTTTEGNHGRAPSTSSEGLSRSSSDKRKRKESSSMAVQRTEAHGMEYDLATSFEVTNGLQTPTWVYDPVEGRTLWGNEAVVAFFGKTSMDEFLAHHMDADFAAKARRAAAGEDGDALDDVRVAGERREAPSR